MKSNLTRKILICFLCFISLQLFAQSPVAPNTADWKLRASVVQDSYGNASLQNSLVSGTDFTEKTTLNPNSERSISVRIGDIANGGMFIFTPENNIGGLQVATFQSTDGSNWTSLNANVYLNGRSDDLQQAAIPASTANRWFRITFTNTSGSPVTLKDLEMYRFSGGRDQYFLILGASLTESTGGHADWRQTVRNRLNNAYQPVLFNWSLGGYNSSLILENLDAFLAAHPRAAYVLIETGGTDVTNTRPLSFADSQGSTLAGLNTQIRQIIQKIIDAGKVPVFSRISYRNYYAVTNWQGRFQPAVNGGLNQENGSIAYNFMVDKIIQELCPMFWDSNERRGFVDMYQLTLNNQQWLVAGDGVHFYGGYAYHMRDFWTDFGIKYLYTGQRTTAVPYTEYVSNLTEKATAAVVKAENSRSSQDIFDARILVEQIANTNMRIALLNRLDGNSTPPPSNFF
ncbi:MAG: hypothetical protein H7Y04_16505, partial [Verrucomicrobia bacterium]|nr:hypothetical protein [Cytophagales bacterium]